MSNYPYVLGVSGASAQPLATRSIELLLRKGKEVHLILSKGAYKVWNAENGVNIPLNPDNQKKFWKEYLNIETENLTCHRWDDNSASIASGSFKTAGMIIIPCSMGTVGRLSSGFSLNLIERCADVHLKEKRTLVIAPREMPWSLIHLRNLTNLAEAGACICPPLPGWYTKPTNIDDMIDFIVIRTFDLFDEEIGNLNRWKEA